MKAEAYFGKNEKWVIRIFDKKEEVARLPLKEPTDESADLSLKKVRLRRNSSWSSNGWGKQATVQWTKPNKKIQEKIEEIKSKFLNSDQI